MATRAMIIREQTPGEFLSDAEILAKVTGQAERQRKINANQRKKILLDNFKEQVDFKLRLMFAEPSYQVLTKYTDVSCNLMKRLVEELSVVYKREPDRTVEPESSQKRYEEITEASHFDIFLDRANYMLNGMNDLIVQTLVHQDEIQRSMLTPDQVTVFESDIDPTVPEALVIEYPFWNYAENRTDSRWMFWSPMRHFSFTVVDGQMRRNSINEMDMNPYAELNLKEAAFYPFAFLHAGHREDSFWDTTRGNSLIEATLLVAIQETFKYFMIPQQFKQLAVKFNQVNDDKDYQNQQISNPLHIFTTNGDLVTIDWQSAIKELAEVIQMKVQQVASDYGLSADQLKLNAVAQSGFSLAVQRQRLDEKRDEQIKFWRIYEREMFYCARASNNLYKLGNKIAPSAKFSINFAEPKTINDPMEELKINAGKIKLGLVSPIDLMMQHDPDLKTRDEALVKLRENIEDRNLVEDTLGIKFGDIEGIFNQPAAAGAGNQQR